MVLCLTSLSVLLYGCSVIDSEIGRRRSSKEECTINKENPTEFFYEGTAYTILDAIVPKDELGDWVGFIQKLAFIDENNAITNIKEIDTSSMMNLNELVKDVDDKAVYAIPYHNVYKSLSGDNKEVIIDAAGDFHRAIPTEELKENDVIISLDKLKLETTSTEKFVIDPQNCTNLIWGDAHYQITEEVISYDELGEYMGTLAKRITFDNDTKQEISKSDLWKIEVVPGELSNQSRISCDYGNVYKINGMEPQQAIAVEINSQYVKAKILK